MFVLKGRFFVCSIACFNTYAPSCCLPERPQSSLRNNLVASLPRVLKLRIVTTGARSLTKLFVYCFECEVWVFVAQSIRNIKTEDAQQANDVPYFACF